MVHGTEDELPTAHADVDEHGGVAHRAGGVAALRRGIEELMRGSIEHQVLIGAAVIHTDDDPRGIGLCQIGSRLVEFEHVLSVNGGGTAQSGEVFAGFGRQGAVTTLVRDDIGTLGIEIGQ